MSRRTKIVGTYRISADEAIQFSITVPVDGYPDELDQAKGTVLKLLHEELADVLAQTRTNEGSPSE